MKTQKILCSCIICKKQVSRKGLSHHIISAHTEEGKAIRRKCGAMANKKLQKESIDNIKNNKINIYNKNPKFCKQCDQQLQYESRSLIFCNSTCSSTYNNKHRDKSCYIKSAKTLQQTLALKITTKRYSKISFCVICGNIIHNKHVQSCSKECKSKLLSIRMKENLYRMENVNKNRGRHKKSYLEESFKNWLIQNNISNFIEECKFRDTINKKVYYADFFFPDFNLIIELDGSQHKNSIEYDLKRDSIITQLYGHSILRVSHFEYQNKSKINIIKELLNIK